jgi:hypothetical protein
VAPVSAHFDGPDAPGLERLAAAPTCSVYGCVGGCLHLQIGPTTLRVPATAIGELSKVLNYANLYLMGETRRAY